MKRGLGRVALEAAVAGGSPTIDTVVVRGKVEVDLTGAQGREKQAVTQPDHIYLGIEREIKSLGMLDAYRLTSLSEELHSFTI